MPISNRKFGVEIECAGLSFQQICRALANVDIVCEDIGYDHTRRTHWKVVPDGSLFGAGPHEYSAELVSPPLFGENGLEEAMKAAKAIARAGATVNHTCGLHVHVDATGLDTTDLANLTVRYARFEQQINTFMPLSRRQNHFCRSMSGLSRRVNETLTMYPGRLRDFISVLTGEERHYKLNLAAYLRHGTIEFRQHNGTVNGTKIVNWIRFCVNFVEQSIVPRENVSTTAPTPAIATTVPRLEALNTLQRRIIGYFQGAIDHSMFPVDIARVANIAPSAVPQYISSLRQLGFLIRKNRRRGVYIMESLPLIQAALARNNQPVVRPLPRITSNDSWSRGLPDEIISFYLERAMEFGQL